MNAEQKLAELGLTLPVPPAAAGSYVPTVRTGNLLYCAGTISMLNGQMMDKVARVVMLNGFVNAVDGFGDSPAVINGASDLFVKVFGDAGKHARAAVAVNGLPHGSTTEVQVVVEIVP